MLNRQIESARILGKNILRHVARFVNRAAQLSWPTHKLYYQNLLRITANRPPLIVYTMGKVGSNTIIRSIVSSQLNFKPYQVHWLQKKNMQYDETFCYQQERKLKKSKIATKFRPTYVWNAEYLLEQFDKLNNTEHKWNVISLTRDPVARNISSFFQNLELFYGYRINDEALSKGKGQVMSELRNLFYDSFIRESKAIHADCSPLTWFTDELGKVFEIDVFDRPFPVQRGWEIYEAQRARILIIKLEKLRACAESAMYELLGVRNMNLANANWASNKPYASLYKDFINTIDLPDHYLNKLYESRYCRHFYTNDEIRRFREKWRPPQH